MGRGDSGDFEVVLVSDGGDSGFGYAVNPADLGLSEWGYGPWAA